MTIEEEIEALELSLLDASVRSDGIQLARLLADDFVEFGSSGRIWTKSETIASLAVEPKIESSPPIAFDLVVRRLSAEVTQVTYKTGRSDAQTSLRSSIWRRDDGQWTMVFHQGTKVQA